MKKILTALLAEAMLLGTASASVLAAENSEFINKKNELSLRLGRYDSIYVQPELYATTFPFPRCSFEESKQMGVVVSEIRGELWNYTTVEEIENANQILDEAVKKMYVADFELEWLLDYMKRDYEDNGYYDVETSEQIKDIYMRAEEALTSKDSKVIHKSYIELRNLLTRLCCYNPNKGDIDGNRSFDINDITFAQRYLAQLEKVNSSQAFNFSISKLFDINSLTAWQRTLSEFNPMPTAEAYDTLTKFGDLANDCTDFTVTYTIDGKEYTSECRELNYMYYTDRNTILH